MVSQKNKQLFLDKGAMQALSFMKEKIFGKVDKFLGKKEIDKIRKTGYYQGSPMPILPIFNPSGRKNQFVLKNAKKNDELDLVCQNRIWGSILVDEIFQVNPEDRMIDIFGSYDENDLKMQNIKKRFGNYAVAGNFDIKYYFAKEIKDNIKNTIKSLKAKKITALMLRADPLHRVHERLIRISLDKSDLLVIFLLSSHREDGLDYSLREYSLRYFVENYLPKEKIIIVPYENAYVFTEHNNPAFEVISAHSFGCNKLVVGQNHSGIEMFFDDNQAHTNLDRYKNVLPIDVVIMPEFVYCNECKTIVSTKTCPHGQHRHIKYHTKSLKALLRQGIMPPSILLRSDISAILLSSLFPARFKNLQSLYDDLFPNAGILENHTERDFYSELNRLYQTTSLN